MLILQVVDFFNKTTQLFATLPSYTFLANAGITPSNTTLYNLTDIQAALKAGHGEIPTIQCTNTNQIDEIWYYYNTVGSVTYGTFYPAPATTPGDCPSQVMYLPKVPGTSPTASASASSASATSYTSSGASTATSIATSTDTSTGSNSSPTATGAPFSGKGYLEVSPASSLDSCLISYGAWYATGTCATYTATSSGSGFTLKSSKGSCAVDATSQLFSCGSNVTTPTVFGTDGTNLQYMGSSAFSSNSTASGSNQVPVYAGAVDSVPITISWQSVS